MNLKKIALALLITLLSFSLPSPAATALPPANNQPAAEGQDAPKATFTGALIILMSVGMGYTARKIHMIRSLAKEDI